ncbi:putative conserved hypothetical protein [Methanothermobacter sp. MT-2]|nr:putative conserved hypothetical protein [Methanothermobacter sp. MT-2]
MLFNVFFRVFSNFCQNIPARTDNGGISKITNLAPAKTNKIDEMTHIMIMNLVRGFILASLEYMIVASPISPKIRVKGELTVINVSIVGVCSSATFLYESGQGYHILWPKRK